MLSRGREERGAAAVMVALVTCFVLFIVAALTVDIGNSWARRGQLQFQVDRAVKFAAETLPVDSTTVTSSPSSSQLAVAKAAAYYMACNAVAGQDDLSTIPACPSGDYTTDAGITTFASNLLANGRTGSDASLGAITFPAVNKVTLRAPDALVSFGFGRMVGADSTTQTKSATAVVLSPGDLLPVGLSVTCMASALGAAPMGSGDTVSKVVPVNYVSTGYPQSATTKPITVKTPDAVATYFADIEENVKSGTINLSSTSTISPSGNVSLIFTFDANRNGYVIDHLIIYIRKNGYANGDTSPKYVVTSGDLGGVESGTVTFNQVLPPGDYEATVKFSGHQKNTLIPDVDKWMDNKHAEFTIPAVGGLSTVATCARPLQSPRLGLTTDADAMAVNIAQGIDHPLAAFPGLGDAVDGVSLPTTTAISTVPGLMATADSAFVCDTNSRVKKDYPTRRTDGSNCVRADTTQDWSDPFTKGLLTGGTAGSGAFTGRLKCPTTGSCNYSASRQRLNAPGGISGYYNDDHFSDFVTNASVLGDPFLMTLDSFISPSLPLVTPPSSGVDDALYDSPRFFWAPIVLKTYVTSYPGAAADYSILSFRPVFLTSDTPSSSSLATVSEVDALLLRLTEAAQASGYNLQTVLQSFTDSPSSLNPCSGVLTVTDLLTSLILTTTQLNACKLALLKTQMFSSTTATTTTVARFLDKYLGSTYAVSDSNNTQSFGGLVIDKTAARVRAARIMTIAPGALPAVAQNYNGPTTDYLGVGPKIIRLTK